MPMELAHVSCFAASSRSRYAEMANVNVIDQDACRLWSRTQVQGRPPPDDTHCIAQPGAKRKQTTSAGGKTPRNRQTFESNRPDGLLHRPCHCLGWAIVNRIDRSQYCYPIIDAFSPAGPDATRPDVPTKFRDSPVHHSVTAPSAPC